MKKYQVITITNKRVLTEVLSDKKTAIRLFNVAHYGFPEGENVIDIYLTRDDFVISQRHLAKLP